MSLSALGIDPANLAYQYTQIDRSAKDASLSSKSSDFSNQISAFNKLKTTLTSFHDSLSDNLDSDSSFIANTASVSDDTALSIETTGEATAGSYDVFVKQLAQSHQVALSFDSTIPLSTNGELNIDLAGDQFSVDLSTLPTDASLSDLASAINTNVDNSGVKASVVRSGTETFLVMTSEESGAANKITIDFLPAATGADTNGDNIADAIAGQTELTAAQDSIIELGTGSAITITSTSNTLEDVIEGVTLNLTQAQEAGDTPLHVTIEQDLESTKNNVEKFVDSFNNLVDSINDNDDLKRDSMASGLASSMRGDFQGIFEGKTLYSVGIEFDRNGNLKIDSDRLEEALASDPDLLNNMLTSENGIMAKLESRIEPYTKSSGLISSKSKTLQASLDIITAKQQSHELSMEKVYQRYLSQFTQMQQTIAQLESTMGQFG